MRGDITFPMPGPDPSFPWYASYHPNGFEMHCVPLAEIPAWENIERCLEEAKREPELSTLFMDADNGGDRILTCPMTLVRATARSLVVLLTDLWMIEGPLGFPREIVWPDSSCHMCWNRVPGGHPLVTGLELHIGGNDPELQRQVLRVLSGEQERLELPEWYPHDPDKISRPAKSLEEARSHPYRSAARIGFVGTPPLLEVPVRMIRVPLRTIDQLALDMVRSRPRPGGRPADDCPDLVPAHEFWIYPKVHHADIYAGEDWVFIHWRWLDDEDARQRARAVLKGERDRF